MIVSASKRYFQIGMEESCFADLQIRMLMQIKEVVSNLIQIQPLLFVVCGPGGD